MLKTLFLAHFGRFWLIFGDFSSQIRYKLHSDSNRVLMEIFAASQRCRLILLSVLCYVHFQKILLCLIRDRFRSNLWQSIFLIKKPLFFNCFLALFESFFTKKRAKNSVFCQKNWHKIDFNKIWVKYANKNFFGNVQYKSAPRAKRNCKNMVPRTLKLNT